MVYRGPLSGMMVTLVCRHDSGKGWNCGLDDDRIVMVWDYELLEVLRRDEKTTGGSLP